MSGLLIKDLYFIKRQKIYFYVILMLILAWQSPAFVASYSGILSSSLVVATMSYDNFEGGLGYLMTLPVTRKTYVRGKYLLSLIVSFSFLTVAMASGVGLQFIVSGNVSYLDFGDAFVSMIAVDTVLTMVNIPSILKWGTEKGRMATFAIVAVCVAAVYVLFETGLEMPAFLRNIDFFAGAAGVLVLSAILRLISYSVSVRILEKKEL